jgi:hypothetical protein
MSMHHRSPDDQAENKKRMMSNQPRLTHVTPTALLGSRLIQLIKDIMSLGTDFKTYANWQEYVEEPAAKDFVTRKACTISSGKARGTH